jgi:hypothetical protein
MEIPQTVIDDLILALHQSQRSTVLIGGTSGQAANDVTSAIGAVIEFASEDVQARLASSYRKSASLP